MKVVYLHQYFVTPQMSGGTRSYEMARRLVALGHEVHIITTDMSETGAFAWRNRDEAGIHVHSIGVRYRNDMGTGRRIAAFFMFALRAVGRTVDLNADVIFATSTPLTVAIPALIASARTGRPFVFEVRDMWPDVPIAIGALRNPVVKWLARRLEYLTYKRASHVVALAPGMREDIIAKGIAGEKVTVIPNGCDLDVFAETSAVSPREQYAWLGDRKLVLFAGTFGRVNGVSYMVDLARAVALVDPEIRFVLIGGGREFEQVRTLAAQTGVLGQSFFMFGAVPKRDLSRWLHAADLITALFTGPRVVWKDAVQNKFFDALAAGRPVASNFDGWQSQIAVAEGVGLMLDPEDTGRAGDELVKALRDAKWMESAKRRAKELAQGPFNRDYLAEQLETVLKRAAQ